MPLLGNVFHLKCGRNDPSSPRNQSGSDLRPMKKMSHLLTDEGKKQLSYLVASRRTFSPTSANASPISKDRASHC